MEKCQRLNIESLTLDLWKVRFKWTECIRITYLDADLSSDIRVRMNRVCSQLDVLWKTGKGQILGHSTAMSVTF